MPIPLAIGLGIGATAIGGALGITGLIQGSNRDREQDSLNEWQQQQYIEQRDYERSLQKQIFQREDTAMQRALQDYTAAGYSPLAAVGNEAGAGAVVGSSSAPSLTASNHTGDALGQMSNSLMTIGAQQLSMAHQEKMQSQQQLHEQSMAESGRAHDKNMLDLEYKYRKAETEQNFFNSLTHLEESHSKQLALIEAQKEASKYLQDDAQQASTDSQTAQFQHDKDMHQLGIDTASQQESALARLVAEAPDQAAWLLDKVGLSDIAEGIRSNPELGFYLSDVIRALEEVPTTVSNYKNMMTPFGQTTSPQFRSGYRQ